MAKAKLITIGALALSTVSLTFASSFGIAASQNTATIDLSGNTVTSWSEAEYGGVYFSTGNGFTDYLTNYSESGMVITTFAGVIAVADPVGQHSLFFGRQLDFTVQNETATSQDVSIDLFLERSTQLEVDSPASEFAYSTLYGGMARLDNPGGAYYDFRTESFDTSAGNVTFLNSYRYQNVFTLAPGETGSFIIWSSAEVYAGSSAVPEPGTLAVIGAGLAFLSRKRKRA